jgi:phosphoglycolate phosphatase
MIELTKTHITLKAAIFDLDGTLVNTLEDIADTMNSVLKQSDMPIHPTEKYKYLVGEGIFELTKKVLPPETWSEQNAAVFVQKFRALYDQTWHDKSLPYPGIMDMLNRMCENGIKVGVLSNKPDSFVQKIITWFFPKVPFVGVSGERQNIPAKPDPRLALEIAEKMNLPIEQIAFIGDSGIDIQTGLNAGMVPIGVNWGFRPVEELISTGASFVVDTPAELMSLF